jgi:flagellin
VAVSSSTNIGAGLYGTSGNSSGAGSGGIVAGLILDEVKLTNANVGYYNVVLSTAAMTVTAVQSTTGLTGVSQTISFDDLAVEEAANRDVFSVDNVSIAAGAYLNVNFDRLGINFRLKNNAASADVAASSFVTGGTYSSSLKIQAGTTQAVFQAGANTRDAFTVNGFKDIRLFDRNLLGDDEVNLQSDYRTFSRLNEILKDMAPQTEAVLSATNFTDLANRLEDVITAVTEIRSGLGAQNNRIEFAIGNIQAQTENMTAAMGRIRDTDFAAETANLTRLQILQQAATAMLSQANQMPNVVLSLLR